MALTWPAKHPDAVLSYSWTIPLDDGDTLATATLSVVDGAVAIDSQDVQGNKLVVVLSGGVDGEVTAFSGTWLATSGQSDGETIYLPVQASASSDPDVAALKLRYSAFAGVDDATIAYWLADAGQYVDTSWLESGRQPGLLAAAAHNMVRAKVAGIAVDTASSAAASGLTRWKSGSADMQFSEAVAARALAGGWESTDYGLDYLDALRRSKGGPLVTLPGVVPCGVWPPNRFGYPY